ncbi:hypothetical protein Asi03nite_48320 [Actinoplanes siamensis]|uniref:Uncharacterized protein n=1 Tax=Actinoplanes siamensis TaxID=1223317 RepID=A0A919NA07_9ACTN|nr:hypothetical protein Asi03nite_48320 [Actinoplanes siamensis]
MRLTRGAARLSLNGSDRRRARLGGASRRPALPARLDDAFQRLDDAFQRLDDAFQRLDDAFQRPTAPAAPGWRPEGPTRAGRAPPAVPRRAFAGAGARLRPYHRVAAAAGAGQRASSSSLR